MQATRQAAAAHATPGPCARTRGLALADALAAGEVDQMQAPVAAGAGDVAVAVHDDREDLVTVG